MTLQHHVFWRSKGTVGASCYEDAFAAESAAGRFAVADGATESKFTDIWARLLVESFAASADAALVPWDPVWLADVRESWRDEVHELLAANFGEHELPWYVETGLRQGALATFLGMVITGTGNDVRWRTTAVGDTCLFHTRRGELLRVFPIEQASQFNCTPRLLASCPEDREQEGFTTEGVGQRNDCLWIATDALAEWCLREEESHRSPWRKLDWLLRPTGTDERFCRWIEQLRSNGRLRNDDVTLLIVTL